MARKNENVMYKAQGEINASQSHAQAAYSSSYAIIHDLAKQESVQTRCNKRSNQLKIATLKRNGNHMWAVITSILSKDFAQFGHFRIRLAMRSSTQLLQKR